MDMSYIMNSKFIILRLTNKCDKGVIKNLLPDSLKSTFEHLPLLLPSKIKLDKPKDSHQPLSGTKDIGMKGYDKA